MPLPPAPTQRASLLSAQAIANAEKAAIAPVPSQRESVAKKTNIDNSK